MNRKDAEERARRWVESVAPDAEPVLYEFDRGWVISARFPPAMAYPLGLPSMILDRESGELVIGGTLPPEELAEWYKRDFQPPHTAELTIGDRRWTAESRPPGTDLFLHPIVSTFFDAMPADYREPGVEHSAEAIVFSEMFIAEEIARAEAGLPRLTLPIARETARGAKLKISPDPVSGTTVPSLPIVLFLDFLGLIGDWQP